MHPAFALDGAQNRDCRLNAQRHGLKKGDGGGWGAVRVCGYSRRHLALSPLREPYRHGAEAGACRLVIAGTCKGGWGRVDDHRQLRLLIAGAPCYKRQFIIDVRCTVGSVPDAFTGHIAMQTITCGLARISKTETDPAGRSAEHGAWLACRTTARWKQAACMIDIHGRLHWPHEPTPCRPGRGSRT
jgi:hypothetical protein